MFKKSIAYRLKVFISFAVFCVFIVFIVANFLFNRSLLRENIENKAITLSASVNALVNEKVVTTQEVSRNIAEQFAYYGMNDNAELLLTTVMEKYPFLNAMHIRIDSSVSFPYHYYSFSNENGQMSFGQGSTPVCRCPDVRQLMEEALSADGPGWSDPYRCGRMGNVSVAYHTPVLMTDASGEKVQIGQVLAELSMTELNEDLGSLKIGERGYAFLINKSGDYITHPIKEFILNRNIFTLPSRILDPKKIDLDEVIAQGKTVSSIAHPEHLDNDKAWAYFSPVERTGWFLVFTYPFTELFRELYRVTFRMFLFALGGLIIVFFFIDFITQKLIDPLSDVTSRLNRLSSPLLKGTGQGGDRTEDEVKMVSDSLEYLKTWFEQYRVAHEQQELNSLRHKQDLQQASEIQQGLIKSRFPAFPERQDIDLHAIYKPARVVSGDLFDYFFLDNDHLLFTIGDVSGKGIPAAIFMSVAQTIIKTNSSYKKAKTMVQKANVELCSGNRHQYFLTLFLGVLNVKTGELNFCNAAHDFPYILKADGKITELGFTHGLPLGLYPDRSYSDMRIKLEKGDTLVLYTDGVTELHNGKKVQFGHERFKASLKKWAELKPAEMTSRLFHQLEVFKGTDFPQTDDICMFVIRYKP